MKEKEFRKLIRESIHETILVNESDKRFSNLQTIISESNISNLDKSKIISEFYLNEAIRILSEYGDKSREFEWDMRPKQEEPRTFEWDLEKEKEKEKEKEEEESNTFEWDFVKDKIDKSREGVKSITQAIEYLENFFDKIKSLPLKLKSKLSKYVIMSFVGLIGFNSVYNTIPDDMPEIKKEVVAIASKTSEPIVDIPVQAPIKASVDTNNSEKIVQTPVINKLKSHPHRVSKSLVDFLKYEEGSIKDKGEPVLTAYELGDGMVTVGWGHAERVGDSFYRAGDVITREKAEELLLGDIQEAKSGLDTILEDWKEIGVKFKVDQGMYDAMVSMIYNMGIGNFRNSEFIQLVKGGRYEEAKEKVLSTNVSYPGHVPRREKESEMFGSTMDSDSTNLSEARKLIRDIIKESMINDNFFAWFDGSKVVDSSGNPLVVHHGTGKKFSKFSLKDAPQGIIWFTSNKESVEAGNVGAQGTGHVMDLYVRIKNPAGWDEYEKYGLGQLEDMRYDGVILPDSDGTITGFVFNPNQLKSVQNKGEWNPGNANIFKEDNE